MSRQAARGPTEFWRDEDGSVWRGESLIASRAPCPTEPNHEAPVVRPLHEPEERPGRAPQEWWSDIERDDRRELVHGSLARLVAAWGDPEEDLSAELEAKTKEVLDAPWFQTFTTKEVEELSAIEDWDWVRLLRYEVPSHDAFGGLVILEVLSSMEALIDEVENWACDDLIDGAHRVAYEMERIRGLATTYGLNLRDLWFGIRVKAIGL